MVNGAINCLDQANEANRFNEQHLHAHFSVGHIKNNNKTPYCILHVQAYLHTTKTVGRTWPNEWLTCSNWCYVSHTRPNIAAIWASWSVLWPGLTNRFSDG